MPEPARTPFSRPLTQREATLSDAALRWFARVTAEDVSSEELCRFEAWKQKNPAHDRAYREVRELWVDPHLAIAAARHDSTSSPSRFARARRSAWLGVAATVVGVTIIALFLAMPPAADYRTATGERRSVVLADGSEATLNTDTAIDVQLDSRRRTVTLLNGEAYFDVARDERRPFIVGSHGTSARAVGTQFVVRQQDDRAIISVIDGTVCVKAASSPNESRRLSAGQQTTAGAQRLSEVRSIDVAIATDWLRGWLSVDNLSLQTVIDEVNRYHTGHIVIASARARGINVTGRYRISDPPNVLATLERTLPISMIRVTDRLIVIY